MISVISLMNLAALDPSKGEGVISIGNPKNHYLFFRAMKGILAHEFGHYIFHHNRNGQNLEAEKIQIDLSKNKLLKRYHISDINLKAFPISLLASKEYSLIKEAIADKIMIELAGKEEARKVALYLVAEVLEGEYWRPDPVNIVRVISLAKYLGLNDQLPKLLSLLKPKGRPWNKEAYVDKLLNALINVMNEVRLTRI